EMRSVPYLRDVRLATPMALSVSFKQCEPDVNLHLHTKTDAPNHEDLFADSRDTPKPTNFQAGLLELNVNRPSSQPPSSENNLLARFADRLKARWTSQPAEAICTIDIEATSQPR